MGFQGGRRRSLSDQLNSKDIVPCTSDSSVLKRTNCPRIVPQGYHLTRSMLILSELLSKTVVQIPRRCWHCGLSGGSSTLCHANFAGTKTMIQLFTKIQLFNEVYRDTNLLHRNFRKEGMQQYCYTRTMRCSGRRWCCFRYGYHRTYLTLSFNPPALLNTLGQSRLP